MSYPCIASRVELSVADGTYELHQVLDEDPTAELLQAGAEPVAKPAEGPQANLACEGKPRSITRFF